jgi:hypothetical protein
MKRYTLLFLITLFLSECVLTHSTTQAESYPIHFSKKAAKEFLGKRHTEKYPGEFPSPLIGYNDSTQYDSIPLFEEWQAIILLVYTPKSVDISKDKINAVSTRGNRMVTVEFKNGKWIVDIVSNKDLQKNNKSIRYLLFKTT